MDSQMPTSPEEILDEDQLKQKAAEESRLNKPITAKFLIKFTIPTIFAFVVMGIFGMIDGIFASRGIGIEALAAVNYVMPFFTFSMAIGAMLSMGGCALVVKKKGKKLNQEARENFSLLTLTIFSISASIALIGWFLRRPLLRLLGTDNEVFDLALSYIQPLILMMPFIMVGMFLIQFLIAEGRPVLGMFASISGAIVSTSLNAIFIFVFDFGVMGLALATGIGYAVPTILGLIYFTFNRKGTIFFVKPKWDIKCIGRSSFNGISEAITMMSVTVLIIIMNNVISDIVGFEGVAAAGMVMALQQIFASLFFGYASGIAPVVSYNYGKKLKYGRDSEVGQERHNNLRKLFKKSLVIISVLSLLALGLAQAFASLLVQIYVSPGYMLPLEYGFVPGETYYIDGRYVTNVNMHAMAVRGLRIVSAGFLLMGFNVFATAWFTAFNNGLVSGIMSFIQTFVLSSTALLTLPRLLDLDGVWMSLPIVEILSVGITIFFLIKMGKRYGYLNIPAKGID